ncbi:twin-arginine translocation signal domain-containing protein [Cyclobacterium qasimii]|nr:twin-arginine translocation signal domain-containing protein [Cyclobacterium qasimii]
MDNTNPENEIIKNDSSRRDFLKTAGLGMAGMGLISPSLSHGAEFAEGLKKKRWKWPLPPLQWMVLET